MTNQLTEELTTSLLDLSDLKMFINSEWITSQNGATMEVRNPSTNNLVAIVPNGGRVEARLAIQAAESALPIWSKLTAIERAKYLLRLRDLLMSHQKELAKIMSTEMGKPFTEAIGEVAYAAGFLEWFAEEGRRVYGETIPASVANKRLMVIRQPVGVTASITPWNFPIAMITRKLGPALAAGCTGVVKPAEKSPLTAIAFSKLVEMAEFPKGVINVVIGHYSEITEEIFNNPAVKKVSFTGSTQVGKLLVEKSAAQLKKLSLELGGHSPLIVFDDADLELAAAGAIASKFRNAGQTCICANRVYVHQSVLQKFTELFVEKAQALKVGLGTDPNTQVGPLVSADALIKVERHINDAVAKGARIITGGSRLAKGELKDGLFFEPTILTDVTDDMVIMKEETFGPVAPIIPFETEEEVIKSANNTEYGLAAYYYTKDLSRAIRVAEALDFGTIGMNDALPAVPQAPFGGMKHSGIGREGGRQGLEEYLEDKFISIGI
jgi:succinate-semialdehyde dehydrogenase / glutarate-semialdehyde dehydrogenase